MRSLGSILSSRLIVLMTLALPLGFGAAPEPGDELKAAVVLSFLRYGEWPQLQPGNAPLTVGVLGRTSFVEVLRRSLDGKSVNDRVVRVIELASATAAQNCQVMYFTSDKTSEIKAALESAPPLRALTIGETKDFLDQGGAVELLVIDGHMSFEVSLEALDRVNVSISSKLLRFGQIRGRKKGDRQ